jgi:protein-disulfide isomerase
MKTWYGVGALTANPLFHALFKEALPMMSRIITLALAAFLLAGLVAGQYFLSQKPEQNNSLQANYSQEAKKFTAQVRQALLAEPTMLNDAMAKLEQNQIASAISSLGDALTQPFASAYAGNPNGRIVVVEFLDFRCPFCRSSHAHMKMLLKTNPELKIVYRPVVFLDREGSEPLSLQAALFAMAAAKQGRYTAFHDAVFTAPGRLSQETLVAAARQAGLAEAQTVRDSASEEIRQTLLQNMEFARSLSVSGTPSFVIGGEVIIGADLIRLDAAIAKAQEAI